MDTVKLLAGQRQNRESSRATQSCNDYLRMGPSRSLRDLWKLYSESEQNTAPTRSRDTLFRWSSKYNWVERAEQYDAQLEAEKTAYAQEIMSSGLALEHERVVKLKWLAGFLEDEIREVGETGVHHNVWVPDVKQIGSGDSAERIDIERYNSALINDYRGVLDDLAKETGGRKQSVKHEGTGPESEIVFKVSGIDLENDL